MHRIPGFPFSFAPPPLRVPSYVGQGQARQVLFSHRRYRSKSQQLEGSESLQEIA